MFRNYLVTAFRNFARHKLYSFINIAGLTVALACAIFIMLFLQNELSYDRFIPHTNDVYRVDFSFRFPGGSIERDGSSMFVLGAAMKAQIPQVQAYTHIASARVTLKAAGRLFSQQIEAVDPDFFRVIDLPVMAGNPDQALRQPNSVVLSQSMARKLFGSVNPIGKTVSIDGIHPMTVTAILKDLPHNTQLKADVLIPNTAAADPMPAAEKRNWSDLVVFLYVRLAPGSDTRQVLDAIRRIVRHNIHPANAGVPAITAVEPHLTPFTAVHLGTYGGGMTPGANWTEIYGLIAIATLILLIASFNFTNLATARAIVRTREVLLRKTMGARRGQLVVQFLAESVITAVIALVLALALVEILVPTFDSFVGTPIIADYLSDWRLTAIIAAVALLTGLLSGFYPAFVLSRMRPAAGFGGQAGSSLLRTALVVLQFAVSIGLGITTIVVFAQIRYARTLDLGFKRSDIVVVRNLSALPKAAREDFRRMVAAEPSVVGAALLQNAPFDGSGEFSNVTVPGALHPAIVQFWDTDAYYPQVFQPRLLTGRFLSRSHATDISGDSETAPTSVVISLAAARRFGYGPESAIGKTLRRDKHMLTIVGVVADQHFNGPQVDVQPIVFEMVDEADQLSVRFRPAEVHQAMAAIDRDWQRFAPNTAIQRYFLDSSFDRLFESDMLRERLFAVFVGIAIFIACLGLYGLAAFAAQSRTREIGIRKVFGAHIRDIVELMLRQFSMPVLIANVIAWPLAYYYLRDWLENYAYRIALSPLYFVGAGVAALLIAWITVAGHAVRVARANPVHALRYE